MVKILSWLRKATEGVAAAMLAAMFLTFTLQIFSRYVLDEPFGWTLEVCLTLWVWIVFWGNAFVVRHNEQVAFDVFYQAAGPRTQRVFALIGAVAIVVGMAWSLLPTWDYIDFLKIKRSSILRIPMRSVFSIYAVFVVAVVIYYVYRITKIVRGENPDDQPV